MSYHDILTLTRQNALSPIDKILTRFSKKWCLVNLTDSYVVYQGPYHSCNELIDKLDGSLYAIMRKRDLNNKERESLDFLRHT